MNVQKIFVSFLVVVFLLFFVLNITYFDKSAPTQDDINIGDNYIGYNEIINSGSKIEIKKINFSKSENSKMYVDNVNFIDRVYFSSGEYEKKQNNRDIEFKLKGGIYLFDLYDLSYNYTISDDGFVLKPKSPGKIFIDNRKQGDIKVFSFDSIIDFTLLSNTNQESMTSLVLYPHMFFGFNSARNKFLRNADLLRIETIARVFYVSDKLLTDNNINSLFFKKLYSNKDDVVFNFLKNFFSLNFSEEKIENNNIENIKLYKGENIFGVNYINKYFGFFLNKEKKVSYYKKNIISNLNKLLIKDIDESSLKDIKLQILSDLGEIKSLDINEYNNFNFVILYYYKNLTNINSIDYVDSVMILSDILILDSEVKSNFNLSKSSFYLNKMYSLVNNNVFSEAYIQKNLMTYLKYFMLDNGIDFKNNISSFDLGNNKNLILKLDYLSFFLKNIFLYDVTFENLDEFNNILDILMSYYYINKNVSFYNNSPLKSETLIIEYSSILDKILSEMRKLFFENNLNDRELLVINKDKTIDGKSVDKLNTTINLFFTFWTSKKSLLSPKNINYNQTYDNNKNKYIEYYSALNNYSDYTIKYDKTKNSLLGTKTVSEMGQDIVLSRDKLIEYLSKFQGVDYSNIKYKIFNNTFYSVSNLYINGEEFSFNLYPKQFNRIGNIVRSGQNLTMSYELDNLEYDWKKMYEEAPDEEKEKYNFSNFFINTFFKTTKQKNDTFTYEENTTNSNTDDKVISLFKRDKLLGDKGEFSILKGFFSVGYNDIQVVLNTNKYDIKILKGVIKTQLNGADIEVHLVSDYVFSEKDHYFKNIYLTFYDGTGKISLYSGKEFNIFGNINILDFKNRMVKEIEKISLSN